ncbi:MAG: 2-oxoacid:acceptor oxidoreductase family protein [Candidatus Rokubacteria bacterium]|nr:2-oxoacid:acceptor oxidoreductase family protein [Candidatus Rokubacteria bacterium]
MTTAAASQIDYREYLRLDMMPHILCPGCGHGIVLKAILRAIHRLGLRREEVAFVSGIGCSSRIVGYVDFCTLHTTHGRPLTFATGLKLARPALHVIVITGDGDGLAIGGNHLIHAARRNVDLTCLLLNNAIYGMTGGQGAPTTPEGARSSITPGGAIEPAFDACRLALGAGASFVARGLTAQPLQLDDLIVQAMEHKGFSFLEVLSDCPEFFGRYNDLGRGPEMLQAQRSHVEWIGAALAEKTYVPGLGSDTPSHGAAPAFNAGVLHREARPDLGAQLAQRATAAPTARAWHPEPAATLPGAVTGTVSNGIVAAGPMRIRLAGAGGQGIVLAGLLLAEAAVAAGRNATHAQAYGPESRGGASKAEVIISDGEIEFPCADRVDALVALTREAYDRYVSLLEPGGTLVVDRDQVPVESTNGFACHALPIAATAQQALGTTMGANLVALGAIVGLTAAVPVEAVERAVAARRPGGSAERALTAFRAGLALGSGLALRHR